MAPGSGSRIRWDVVGALARRWLLPIWFAILSAGTLFLLGLDAIGVDARINFRGSQAWPARPWARLVRALDEPAGARDLRTESGPAHPLPARTS